MKDVGCEVKERRDHRDARDRSGTAVVVDDIRRLVSSVRRGEP